MIVQLGLIDLLFGKVLIFLSQFNYTFTRLVDFFVQLLNQIILILVVLDQLLHGIHKWQRNIQPCVGLDQAF